MGITTRQLAGWTTHIAVTAAGATTPETYGTMAGNTTEMEEIMAKYKNSVSGKVTRTEAVGRSRSGNPTYDVAIEDEKGDFHIHRTMTDSAIVYGINNSEYRDNVHTFEINKTGRLTGRCYLGNEEN